MAKLVFIEKIKSFTKFKNFIVKKQKADKVIKIMFIATLVVHMFKQNKKVYKSHFGKLDHQN